MPRSSQNRIATVALSVLLLCAAPALAGPWTAAGGPAPIKVQDGLLQAVWSWLGSLWSAFGEEGDAGARIDGNGALDGAGARIDGNGLNDRAGAQIDGDAGARIDGNGAN